ncbi:MAG: TauD/TfdA dioxygenase family protein [Acidimicrobiales bacterium]
MNLEITPLPGQPLGALVEGWEPDVPLDEATKAVITDGLRDHLVLVFRGHAQPTDDQLVRFAQSFGPLIAGSEWFRDAGERPEILPVTNAVGDDGIPLGTGGAGPLEWHADYSYAPSPGKESFLDAVELPPDGPCTYFCNQYEALTSLPDERVEQLRGLRAHHSLAEYVERGHGGEGRELDSSGFEAKRRRDERLGIERPPIPEAEHSVVLRHPDSGREILYVSKGLTRRVLGMTRDESNALLKELHLHSTAPDRVYAHRWQVGDLVVFDTLGALHRRDAWESRATRVMRQLSTSC